MDTRRPGIRDTIRTAARAAVAEVARAWSPPPTAPTPRPDTYAPASAYAGYPTDPEYSPADAMSAYSAFPWVYACLRAISEDLAGLPLYAQIGTGPDADRLDDHPALALLEEPAPGVDGALAREQRVVDLYLTGSCWDLVQAVGEPVRLSRLHPDYVRVVADPAGQPYGWQYQPSGGAVKTYAASDVVQVRLPSWESDTKGLFGTGSIRPLHRDLTATAATAERTAQTARQGRPAALLSPAPVGQGEAAKWDARQVKEVDKIAQEMTRRKDGGIAVLNSGIKLDILGWSPRDLEYVGQLGASREAVLAVFGVPPTRLQLPTANYAASRDGMIQYWQNLRALAARISAGYTRIARRFYGSERVRILHDFSGVPYLQEDRDARLARVQIHVSLGIPAAAAYAYEGFADAPVPAAPENAPADPAADAQPEPDPAADPAAEPADPLAETLDAIAADDPADTPDAANAAEEPA